ncbi:branched-chain amino acid transporter permease [Tomitella gaofuii]|uniref:branched-chain amino acid transporter permease n=1 Tax=Tomitella gaofuii TaxID=2760083 RepID=UPI0015FA53D3|nr:AzlD domain-containing protein [Tomitella gaofuii]
MPSTGYLLGALTVILVVTFGLRALPFAFVAPVRSSSLLRFLGAHMPVGIMVILTVYTLAGTPLTVAGAAPAAAALAASIGLHLWRSHALVSIIGGTGLYVLLVQLWG